LSNSSLSQFASLLLEQPKFHELDIGKGTGGVLIKKMKVTDEVPIGADVP